MIRTFFKSQNVDGTATANPAKNATNTFAIIDKSLNDVVDFRDLAVDESGEAIDAFAQVIVAKRE